MSKIYLVDVNYFIYSGHHATSLTSRGLPIGGTYVTVKNMLKLTKLGTKIVACLDSAYSYKKERISTYKANRTHKPEIESQRQAVITFLQAMGIPIATEYGYEADDVIATLSEVYSMKQIMNFIVGVDKDLYACVNKYARMLNLQSGELLDADGVHSQLGVYPERVEELLALMGDSADGFKGVPGIGRVSASNLCSLFPSIKEMLESPELIPDNYRRKIMSSKALDSLRESIVLATLDRGVPNLEEYYDPADYDFRVDKFNELCRYHGFKSLEIK